MLSIQEIIHKFEVGEGTRIVRSALGILAIIALGVLYDVREFKDFNSAEAMDQAQLARNLAAGEGYTTRFIRPLSMHLLEEQQRAHPTRTNDFTFLKSAHPDLANPPVYPLVLSAVIKALPFRWEIPKGEFVTYQPELLIALFNQVLLLTLLLGAWTLARKLFDNAVALMTVILIAGGDLFWRFSVSGLSTLLLLNILVALCHVLVRFDTSAAPPAPDLPTDGEPADPGAAPADTQVPSTGRLVLLAGLAGLILGLGLLTRYSFGWLLIPSALWIGWTARTARPQALIALIGAFLLVVSPWLARNQRLSGHWFGTAALAAYSETRPFPNDQLARNLKPPFARVTLDEFVRKLLVNGARIAESDLPRLGGSWITAFFLVGLLVPFRNPTLGRLRWFLVASIAVLAFAQAIGQTHASTESPVFNGENHLVLVAPLVFVFGSALFFILLDQVPFTFPEARALLTAGVAILGCAPLAFKLLPPREHPLAYPPYYPPIIQTVSHWMKPAELIMADMPWAVAWYGNRQSIWAVLDVERDFYAVHDYQKPVSALYLSQITLDRKFYSDMVKTTSGSQDRGWEWFLFKTITSGNLPKAFPLKASPDDPARIGQLFLTDRDRWSR